MEKIDISTILASAIHESKNQIGTMLYQLQSLKESVDNSDSTQTKITSMEESLKKLNDEWVEYLYLYRLASDGYIVRSDIFLLDEFLDDQVFALSTSAMSKNLKLSYQCDPALTGTFDERLMAAVVSTAVYNALRFAQSEVLIQAKRDKEFLIISIEDDGKGFELAEEEDEILSANATGLGLYFAQLSTQAHEFQGVQGKIQKATSTSLGGASLLLMLPQP